MVETGTLLAHDFPDLFIEGTQTAAAQGMDTMDTRLDDVPRQTMLSVSPNSANEFVIDQRVTLHSTDGELTVRVQ